MLLLLDRHGPGRPAVAGVPLIAICSPLRPLRFLAALFVHVSRRQLPAWLMRGVDFCL
jgi:hypothetical protein